MDIETLEKTYAGKPILIIGNGPSGKHADFSEYSKGLKEPKKVWVFSCAWHEIHPYADLGWYMDDVHGPDLRVMQSKYSYQERVEMTANPSIPIITSHAYDYPQMVNYPLERIVRFFKLTESYFAETLNFAMAWGIMIGVKSLDLWGVDYKGVRPSERASFEYWAGRSNQAGIPIYNNPFSEALNDQGLDGINRHVPNLYGYLPHHVPVPYHIKSNGATKFGL